MSDNPKVAAATLVAKDNHYVLTMTTMEKVNIQFDLDDMALSLLMLTGGSLLAVAKSHATPTLWARELNEDNA